MKKKKEDKALFTASGFFILFLLFSLTLGLGILVSLRLYELVEIQEWEIAPISPWQFLFHFVSAFCLILVIFFLGRKFQKKKRYLLKGLFLMSVGLGMLITLGVFIGNIAIILVIVLVLMWLARPNVFIQDVLIILGMAGAGSFLGVRLAPETVVLLLILFSIYDYIAVYKTKHMVSMAKEMIKEGAILGLILPQSVSDFRASLKEVMPGQGRFFVLGGGDVVFPLLLSSSLLTKGVASALIVAVFSLLGLFSTFFIFTHQKIRRPIPALPPIALFAIIGYLITLLI